MLTLQAYAKINLSLEVIGRRDDGYHELLSVMQTVSVSDRVELRTADSLSCTCSDPSLSGASNLAFRAAGAFLADTSGIDGCAVRIDKQIPLAAGLGGGSSDAAATLAGLNALLGTPLGCPELTRLAASVGSDVPFFLTAGAALVGGRGEVVTPLESSATTWYLLVKPSDGASTGSVFEGVTSADWSDGEATRRVARGVAAGERACVGVNGLTRSIFAHVPETERVFERLSRVAPGRTLVSGSGSTVFAAFSSREEAHGAERTFGDVRYWTRVVQAVLPPISLTPCR